MFNNKNKAMYKKHKRAKNENEKSKIENRITEISKEIFPLTKDLKYCKQIQERMEFYRKDKIYEEMVKEKKELEKDLNKKEKKRVL